MRPLAIRNILVATDFEADSAVALESVFELAGLAGSQVHIVHAGIAAPGDQRIPKQIAELEAALNRSLDVSLLAGPPAAAITQEATRTQADVIVLGHHRSHAGAPGSTADRVVRSARIPCLILPKRLALPLSTVLVPVDISAVPGLLDVALTWASALRRRSPGSEGGSTRVEVLYVQGSDGDGQAESRLDGAVKETRERLAHITPVDIAARVVRAADVPATILSHAEQSNAAMLVIGTRAKRIDTDPLGSVSSAVVSEASRPVLLVPPELWRAGPGA